MSPESLAQAGGFFTTVPLGKPVYATHNLRNGEQLYLSAHDYANLYEIHHCIICALCFSVWKQGHYLESLRIWSSCFLYVLSHFFRKSWLKLWLWNKQENGEALPRTCCSVAKLCLSLCDPMDCSTLGSSVLHYLPEFAQTHVHGVGDDI